MESVHIPSKIHVLRGQRVLLDFDLAALYGVPTKALKQAVRRNPERFPPDFMFELTREELNDLRSQIVTSSWGGLRHLPFAFTEHGVAMLSSVLNSETAIQINISIVRVFVALRQQVLTPDELVAKVLTHEDELTRIQEVLHWLGEENQARSAEIATLTPANDPWQERQRIGFKP